MHVGEPNGKVSPKKIKFFTPILRLGISRWNVSEWSENFFRKSSKQSRRNSPQVLSDATLTRVNNSTRQWKKDECSKPQPDENLWRTKSQSIDNVAQFECGRTEHRIMGFEIKTSPQRMKAAALFTSGRVFPSSDEVSFFLSRNVTHWQMPFLWTFSTGSRVRPFFLQPQNTWCERLRWIIWQPRLSGKIFCCFRQPKSVIRG